MLYDTQKNANLLRHSLTISLSLLSIGPAPFLISSFMSVTNYEIMYHEKSYFDRVFPKIADFVNELNTTTVQYVVHRFTRRESYFYVIIRHCL